ncbi:hypothetical protein KUTeg_016864, partial [Tegillarca granosa]
MIFKEINIDMRSGNRKMILNKYMTQLSNSAKTTKKIQKFIKSLRILQVLRGIGVKFVYQKFPDFSFLIPIISSGKNN